MADGSSRIKVAEANSDSLLESAMDVRLIRRIAIDSGRAIYKLWNDDGGCYWRDTKHRDTATPKEAAKFFPTVTYRSTEALLELILRSPDWLDDSEVQAITQVYVPRIFTRSLAAAPSALDDPGGTGRNPFTTALYLITACRANEIVKNPKTPVDSAEILAAAGHLIDACTSKKGTDISERHPFTQFHVIRAVNTLLPLISGNPIEAQIESVRTAIVRGIKTAIEKLLARRTLKQQLAPSDAVALIFCAAALAFDDRVDEKHYILPALMAGFEAQEVSGCWPLGRVVRRFRRRHREARDFTISTYEIAWATSETLLKLLQHRESIPEDKLMSALEKLLAAGRYTERSIIELEAGEPNKGWSSDPPYAEALIESWTSANVLQSIISLNELIDEVRCNQTLKSFVVLDPSNEEWPTWKRWTNLRDKEEPDDEYPIFSYLAAHILEPIQRNPQKLPSSEEETVSALFFGPPGTSKTTLAHALADALRWPIVILSPGDFIEEGLEGIEAQARKVFSRLQKLRRAVVLFDECDELFRNREPKPGSEQQRNITAFVTACMLPKLQDLHDRGRVLFCICTNKFDTLDSAIQRGGRVDHVIGVPPPQAGYRKRLVERQFNLIADGPAKSAAVQALIDNTDRFTRLEIQRACQVIIGKKVDWTTAKGPDLGHLVAEMAKKMEESLTITELEYKAFNDAKGKYSHPVTRKEI